MKKILLSILALCFAALLGYSGYRVWDIGRNYKAEAAMHGAVMEYKPAPDHKINQSVLALQAKYPDAAGWLTVPGTKIDYPFVWHENHNQYLRRDLDGNYTAAGTLFMDQRCAKEFSARNTIIYGHNMKNDSMLGTLRLFERSDFFRRNTQGVIYLPHETLTLEFFAYMVVQSTDEVIYNTAPSEGFLVYVQQNARHYREIGLTEDESIVTLSTCSYAFSNARMVLLARAARQ